MPIVPLGLREHVLMILHAMPDPTPGTRWVVEARAGGVAFVMDGDDSKPTVIFRPDGGIHTFRIAVRTTVIHTEITVATVEEGMAALPDVMRNAVVSQVLGS